MNIIEIYSNILGKLLSLYSTRGEELAPTLLNRAKANVRAAIIIVLFAKEHQPDIQDVISATNWLEEKIGSSCLLTDILNSLDDLEWHTLNFKADWIEESYPLGPAYEAMLTVDTEGDTLAIGKRYRNTLGSYYTPTELVECLTQETMESYIKDNGTSALAQAKIVDFSCGAGAFLVAALKEIIKRIGRENTREVANHLYACDVDPIALEIAKFSIIDVVKDFDIYPILNQHFTFGNFLIHTKEQAPLVVRTQLYLDGFINHPKLAVGENFLSEYDIILGNPPWEKIRFEEKKFYSQYEKSFAGIHFKSNMAKEITHTERSNSLLKSFAQDFKTAIETCKKQIKGSPYFAHSNLGELNTSTLFAEACYNQVSASGTVGIIVKSSSLLSPCNKVFFKHIKKHVLALYDFINRNKYFDIDSRERYTLLLLSRYNKHLAFRLGMNLVKAEDIKDKCMYMNTQDLKVLNPETEQLPNISNAKELEFMLHIHKEFSTLGQECPKLKFGRIVHYTLHVNYLDKQPNDNNIAVYEGKFFNSFDGCYSGYNDVPMSERYVSKATTKLLNETDKARGVSPLSRFYIHKEKWAKLSSRYSAEYMLAWHSLTSATNARACVATLLPFIPASQSVQFLISNDPKELLYLSCLFNSVVFDYLVKNKLSGIDLTQSIIKQVPIPSFVYDVEKQNSEECIVGHLFNIAYTLLHQDKSLQNFWKNFTGLQLIEGKSRKELFIKLDALVARLYHLNGNELLHILKAYSKLYTDEEQQTIKKELMAISIN